jgi:hypothetical protein
MGRQIPGYKKKVMNRKKEDKKGGGIAAYWNKSLRVIPWEGLQINKDRLWIKVKNPENNKDQFVCTIYMGQSNKRDALANGELFSLITNESKMLKENGYDIMILGDFNAHMKKMEKDKKNGNNKNGDELEKMVEELEVKIINKSEKCIGKWTWSKNNKKSIVDYVLACDKTKEKIQKMNIDDEGEYNILSDHNLIQIKLEIKAQKINRMKEQKWDIKDDTDWDTYRVKTKEMMEKEKEKNNKIMYEKFVDILTEAGKESIGMKKGSKWNNNRSIRKKKKKRNALSKEWTVLS